MLRLACCLATERGIRVAAPIRDALLVEAPVDEIEHVVSETQAAMREASETVLSGFSLRSDAEIVCYPHRYMDKRGERMWDVVSDLVRGMDG
jgi:DNA polymerase-1